MVPFAEISPELMKQVLILDGWKERRRDEFNWLLSKGRKYLPIVRRQLFLWVDDNYFFLSTTITL